MPAQKPSGTPTQPTTLDNLSCIYCGVSLENRTKTKEHVIGRRFVPKGKLDRSWNLIARACLDCNRDKADLEDDISAISMQPSVDGEHATDDSELKAEAVRKGGSFSRMTGKRVDRSSETFELQLPPFGGLEIGVTLTGPPRIDEDRLYELASLHVRGFFYFVTYDSLQRTGGFFPCYPLQFALRSDWGNSLQSSFMSAVAVWEPRLCLSAAGGFFKAMIRRQPDRTCWAWALEWNQNIRVIGFSGDMEAAQEVYGELDKVAMKPFADDGGSVWRHRFEQPLQNEDDLMFDCFEDSQWE